MNVDIIKYPSKNEKKPQSYKKTKKTNVFSACRAFTLVELLIVVIVIGILVSLAVPNYLASVERSKAGKAQNALLAIRNTQTWYRAHMDNYCDNIPDLQDWGLPLNAITSDTDWTYSIHTAGAIDLEIRATRQSGPYQGEYIGMDEEGHLTISNPGPPWNVK